MTPFNAPDFPQDDIRVALAHQAGRHPRHIRLRHWLMTSALCLGLIPLLPAPLAGPALAQQSDTAATSGAAEDAFASENAILDTAIPFAIGARQAQQSLRGSFGWPTFQEGLVEGVYFRFDPDGYARFAPTPRLDSDVFEVICRPRTLTCIGRKGPMTLILTSRGQLQIQLESTRPGDRYFVAEGVTEIELPETILAPLEPQMELLLAAGGDLVVKRGEVEADRISLTGLYPVGAYLRWVAAAQDYSVLPRGWPIPNGRPQSAVASAVNWNSPMPQPQGFPQTGETQNSQTQTPQTQSGGQTQEQVAEVRGELRVLRELLLNRDTQTTQPPQPAPGAQNDEVTARIAELQRAAEQIQADLARLRNTPDPQPPANTQSNAQIPPQPVAQNSDLAALAASLGLTQNTTPQTRPAATQNPTAQNMPTLNATGTQTHTTQANQTAQRLNYLITEIGLDPKTALTILEMSNHTGTPQSQTTQTPQNTNPQSPLFREKLVAQIIAELETQNPDTQKTQQKKEQQKQYNLISKFLKNSMQ